jgi:hypothetical protein
MPPNRNNAGARVSTSYILGLQSDVTLSKVKIKLSLGYPTHQGIKMYGEWSYSSTINFSAS